MQVSVLGCGWLGHEVALGLINKGYGIKGSTTTPGKLSVLQNNGIVPYLVNLENPEPQALTGFLQGSEVLIINIPPKLKDSAVSYPDKMRALVPYIVQAGITKVLFVSSTSVYADAFPFPVITEETPPSPTTESGRQIIEAEQVLQNNTAFTTTILRLSGLYGGLRHPVYHLAGRADVANPEAPINLVGLDTASRVIYGILQHNAWGTVFLAAERKHISREAYYTQKAKGLGLEPPQFNHTQRSVGKIILADKVQRILDFKL
jgi:nucleoside-diphosphate-sugar epimerase